jgi:Holliday junction resolvasome RuvABC ATP-dependent DNA helicase subunit
MILSALKGHGKTTFIELFAKALGAKLIERIGRQVDEDEIVNIVNEINQSKEPHVILFIDEIDTMDWKVLKIFNTMIEQFKINEKQIKPFIFASATISKHLLVKNNPDLLDRIPHSIQFVRYNAEDIAQIVRQYQAQLYPDDKISDNIILTIAKNCKFNPRTSISLLEDYIVEQNITKVLQNRHIIEDGLDIFDIKVLEILAHSNRPLGSNALSLKVGMGEQQYLREIEPFLLEFGYIQRIPSRAITAQGLEFLRKIKENSNG